MQYTTTKIKAIKSYPTYQLHAETVSEKVSKEDVFKICILETFRWIRSRLESFDTIPKQLDMPSPDNYEMLDLDSLYSFSIDTGFTIDVVYVRSEKIWSFNITESDMGANMGKENERQPVFGRSFGTDISFRLKAKSVEVGIRTVCSEPVDSSADCEVFRPALVKCLANNPLVGLREFYPINGQAVDVSTKSAVEGLAMYSEKYADSLPLVIVCSAGTKNVLQSEEGMPEYPVVFNAKKVFESIDANNLGDVFPYKNRFVPDAQKMEFTVDLSNIELDIKKPLENEKQSVEAPKKSAAENNDEKESIIELENIDYSSIARHAMGFAHVCFVGEQCIGQLSRKINDDLHEGDIAFIYGGELVKKYTYSSYCKRMNEFRDELCKIIALLPKGRSFNYGKILFHTDARLLEIEEKRSETMSYEGKFSLLTIENDELKRKVKELEQLNTGKSVNSEELRKAVKKVRTLEEEKDRLQAAYDSLSEKFELVSGAYKASSGIIDFYRYKAEIAAHFPKNKDDVCDWVENELCDNIILSPNVRSEMKKYSGEMDIAMLCDGLLFIDGYAKYRKCEIDNALLNLYAESGKWQIESCGAEALKVYKEDYSASVNGKKYLMDMHIKYGVNPKVLIRVYFCWDESAKKIIIGHMPTHLATLKQNT